MALELYIYIYLFQCSLLLAAFPDFHLGLFSFSVSSSFWYYFQCKFAGNKFSIFVCLKMPYFTIFFMFKGIFAQYRIID